MLGAPQSPTLRSHDAFVMAAGAPSSWRLARKTRQLDAASAAPSGWRGSGGLEPGCVRRRAPPPFVPRPSSLVPRPSSMRRAVFGGSFNPPHLGHLVVAETCADAASLDRVVWMPAATPPHKQGDPDLAPADVRLALVERAVAGNDRFVVSDLELRRAGVSYTVDTLRQLADAHPGDELALIVGGDSLSAFASWREPRAILDLARLRRLRASGLGRRQRPSLGARPGDDRGRRAARRVEHRRSVAHPRRAKRTLPRARHRSSARRGARAVSRGLTPARRNSARRGRFSTFHFFIRL